MKQRLDLTVTEEFKKKAKRLARKRRRSISALFEDLIESEVEREKKAKRKKLL
jgi:predicted transcriptional regulator